MDLNPPSLLSIRDGLTYVLASSHSTNIGGDQIDDNLIKFFATNFTKISNTPSAVCPSNDISDKHAKSKPRLAVERTKRTIRASLGAASCSVESLKDGVDYTGSSNRMRFDKVIIVVYLAIATAVSGLSTDAGVDAHKIDEIIHLGGSACLPDLDECFCLSGEFRDDIEIPFSSGTVGEGGIIDPTTILARGSAFGAVIIS